MDASCRGCYPHRDSLAARAIIAARTTGPLNSVKVRAIVTLTGVDTWMCEDCEGWFPAPHMQDSEGRCSFCVEAAS